MKWIYKWYTKLSKRLRDSIHFSFGIVGFVSIFCTVLGFSLANIGNLSIWIRVLIVLGVLIFITVLSYIIIGRIFSNEIDLTIRNTDVLILYGDIFKSKGWKVIGCDNHFDTRADDMVIAKKSLQGQLLLKHGRKEEIKAAVEREAKRLHLQKGAGGLYEFPLGTVIRYHSSVDNQTYLLLAMTRLNENYEAHTNMAEYEQTLMRMWREIDRVYALNDIAIPVLGAGIPRFDSGPMGRDALLRCMLCTLNGSGVNYKNTVRIVIYGDANDISLYEYKNTFQHVIRG